MEAVHAGTPVTSGRGGADGEGEGKWWWRWPGSVVTESPRRLQAGGAPPPAGGKRSGARPRRGDLAVPQTSRNPWVVSSRRDDAR